MNDHEALFLDDFESSFFGDLERLGGGDPELEPDLLQPQVGAFTQEFRDLLRPAKDDDQLDLGADLFGHVRERGMAGLAEDLRVVRVDSDDPVAMVNHVGADAVRDPAGIGRETDDGEGPAVLEHLGRISSGHVGDLLFRVGGRALALRPVCRSSLLGRDYRCSETGRVQLTCGREPNRMPLLKFRMTIWLRSSVV